MHNTDREPAVTVSLSISVRGLRTFLAFASVVVALSSLVGALYLAGGLMPVMAGLGGVSGIGWLAYALAVQRRLPPPGG